MRTLIADLRRGDIALPDTSAARGFGPLLADLSKYWGITARLDDVSTGIVIPGALAHQLRQVLREAVANAVRHGGASRVAIALAEENGMLHMTVADDGAGFADDPPSILPRSISERIAGLSGALRVESASAGATLDFALPLERR